MSRIMISAVINRKNALFTGVYEKRLTGRFALPNKKRHLDSKYIRRDLRANPKPVCRTRNWYVEPEIGRANLLVSRMMMFAITDR